MEHSEQPVFDSREGDHQMVEAGQAARGDDANEARTGALHDETLYDQNEDRAGERTRLDTGQQIDNSTYDGTENLTVRDDIPSSVRYPLERVMGKVNDGLDYFTSTVAYALGLAIDDGFQEIHIYGIDLVVQEEYFYQKACVEYYLGVAHGRGISIYIPQECALLKQSHRYGYEYGAKESVLKLLTLNEIERLEDDLTKTTQRLHTLQGALQTSRKIAQLMEVSERGSILTVRGPSTIRGT